MTDVLADTGPLYALAFGSDQYHVRARDDLKRLEANRQRVIVTFSTVIECYRLILYGSEARYALRWFDELRESAELVNPTADDYVAAAQRIQRYSDQRITLVDGVLAVASERLNLPVCSYDHHFDVMRVDRWH